jgi:hypothetical protein
MRALLLPCLVLGCATAASETRSDEAPLVIELFTSQGCSSCPPADKLLDKLARDGALGGRPLAPLAFHVDYWDDLGWPDPFASPAWSERQRQYATALGDDRVYTPELVVGGRTGLVGSNAARAAQAIASAPRQRALAAKATWTTDALTIEVTAPAGADVFVAIWQDGTKTAVPRGENAGTTLRGDRIVRRLERVATSGKSVTATIAIDRAWGSKAPCHRSERSADCGGALGAVAFAQQTDKTIVASALLPRT